MIIIPPSDLVPMDIFTKTEAVLVDLVYADASHNRNIFKEALYHDEARFWAHKDIALITLITARKLNNEYGYSLELKDCLRTTEAQAAMGQTQIVRDNPDWLEEPNRMVSPPGHGAHPRGMAIDVCVLDKDGNEVDMGTPFDDMDQKSYRNCPDLSDEVKQNRQILEEAFMESAKKLNMDFLPLPAEWWDFRFPADSYRQYTPISDADLPPQMQMTKRVKNDIPDFSQEHFDKLAEDILYKVHENI
jgi:D-alanyl-D-alanine dipeptidase